MKASKNPVFPAIIAIASLAVMYRLIFHPFDVYGIVSVIVGITGIVLYYRGHSAYDIFFYAWVILQFPNLHIITELGAEVPVANAFPAYLIPFNLSVGLVLRLANDSILAFYINLLPVGLYYLLRFLNADKPLGQRIIIDRFREGTFPQIRFPLKGTIEKVSGRHKLKAVYQVALDNEIGIGNGKYSYILLEPKEEEIIQPGGKKQICGLRLTDLSGAPYSERQYPFIDWVSVRCAATDLQQTS